MPARLRTRLPALGIPVLLACASPSASRRGDPEDPRAVRAAVSEAWRAHIDAAKRKDLVGVMAIYADEATYLVPGAQEVRGRPALQQMESQGLAAADVLEAAHTTHDLRTFGSVAFEIGTVAGPVRPRDGSAHVVVFRFMAMWERSTGGEWRIRCLVGRAE